MDSDHKMVCYLLRGWPPTPTYQVAGRTALDPNVIVEDHAFAQRWTRTFREPYWLARERKDVEAAYKLITEAAEGSMAAREGEKTNEARARCKPPTDSEEA